MKYDLDMDQMAEAEMVMEQMGNDPDAVAFELVWHRHHAAQLRDAVAELIAQWPGEVTERGPDCFHNVAAILALFHSANDNFSHEAGEKGLSNAK